MTYFIVRYIFIMIYLFSYLHTKNKALFRCENFLDFTTVALSFVCDKYYPIMD